jgi:hypothetical protein
MGAEQGQIIFLIREMCTWITVASKTILVEKIDLDSLKWCCKKENPLKKEFSSNWNYANVRHSKISGSFHAKVE